MKHTRRTALRIQQLANQQEPSNYPGKVIILFPKVPLVFDGLAGNVFELWLDGNVTITSTKNLSPGILYTFIIRQLGTGHHRFVWPSTSRGGMTINPKAGSTSIQSFVYKPADALYAVMPGSWA